MLSNWLKARRAWLTTILAVAVAFGVGYGLGPRPDRTAGEVGAGGDVAVEAESVRWTCSMHPQIILPTNDQKCPICFMDLIPLDDGGGEGLGPSDLALSDNAAALAEIATETVRREFVSRDLRLVGKVVADETGVKSITARVNGRLDRLYVDSTGQVVRPGEKLAEIYSPQLYTAQAELRAAAAAAAGGPEATRSERQATLRAARARLRLWGMSGAQIDAILAGGAPSEHLTVTAPTGGVVVTRRATQGEYVQTGSLLYAIADLSRVWVTLDALETDVAWLREGQPVTFAARAWPGRRFDGEVLFIDPVLNERTRSVEVRVAVANEDALLKPGMLVTGTVAVVLDSTGSPIAGDAVTSFQGSGPLVIPATAPLLTGARAVVYVKRQGSEGPVFSGRQVTLGPRAGDHYLVVDGLHEGEEVVTRGSFKIDSALQIQAKSSMMAAEPLPTGITAVDGPGPLPAPDCFIEQLGRVLGRYFLLQNALASDDDETARTAVHGVQEALSELDCDDGRLAAGSREVWLHRRSALEVGLKKMASSSTIADRRLPFETVSDQLWLAILNFGGERLAAQRFHCPMVGDGAGAHWIQDHATVANPYYGATMLRCGSRVGGVGDGSAAESVTRGES